jgi:membrane protein DedA with SNARE-associated domain
MSVILSDPIQYLADNAYAVIFLVVFVEQVGVPLPSAPVLVAAGALAAEGRISLVLALGVSLVAAQLADALWYALGRRFGTPVLTFLCRLAIEPDHCVRLTEDGFARHGPWLLVIAKFVPGLETAAPPLAGLSGIGLPRFLLFDSAGILAQVSVVMSIGYSLSGTLARFVQHLPTLHWGYALPVVALLLAFIGWKYTRRRRLLRDLRVERVSPADLKAELDAGERVVIFDLRHPLEQKNALPALPGAIRVQPQELEARFREIPRDRDVVLYCT